MIRSTAGEVMPPTVDDFELVKESFLEAMHQPGARLYPSKDWLGQQGIIQRDVLTIDYIRTNPDVIVSLPMTVVLLGKLTTTASGEKLLMRYKEMPRNPLTINNGLSHDYILRHEDGEMTEFGQSIWAAPLMDQQPITARDILLSDERLNQVQEGEKILKSMTGNQCEATAGDCGVLFDRIIEYFL